MDLVKQFHNKNNPINANQRHFEKYEPKPHITVESI